jgi:hypothetical protein
MACSTRIEIMFASAPGRAQRHRALEAAVVVLGLPGLAAGDAGVEEQRRVVDMVVGEKPFSSAAE